MIDTTTNILAADLFCGAGGTSTGLMEAAHELGMRVDLIAINHWSVAIASHKENHPFATHYCQSVETVRPQDVVPDGYLRLLVASPECIYHSNARGGKPINDQKRTSPFDVLRWMEALYIEDVLIENVKEFMEWGPVDRDGKKIQRLKGKTFLQFLGMIEALGYNVDYRVLNAANYGDPTTRERLFIICRRDKPIVWPEATHANPNPKKNGRGDAGVHLPLFNQTLKPWRTAREIVDWSIPGESIYNRERIGKKALVPNTMRRIYVGLEKFCGLPFVLGQQSCAAPRGMDQPLPTVATEGAIALVNPFLISLEHAVGKQEAFIVTANHGKGDYRRAYSVDEPMRTVTTVDAWALVQPFLVNMFGTGSASSIDDPMPTVTASTVHQYLAQPFLVKYYGSGDAVISVDEPMPTVTVRDRFALCEPLFFKIGDKVYMLDILYRMLLPHELAAAQGFQRGYKFSGNRGDVVKQIGNAVPRNTARALCQAILA